jgi:hypothetical protein
MLECRLLSRVWVIVFHNSFLHENHVDSRLRCYADLDVLRCYSLRCILKVYSIYRWVILVYNCLLGTVPLFSSPDPKGHVSYCQHLASVVRRKRFQKSSPLKVLDQWKPHLVWIITRVSSCKIVQNCRVGRSWYAAHICNLKLTFISYSFWYIRRKVLKFYKFDEKRAIKRLTLNCKYVRHINIYPPCNFEVNPNTHFRVISLFFIKFSKF